jgi:hypothetical protein
MESLKKDHLPKNFNQSISPHKWEPGRSGNPSGRYGSGIDRLVRKMLRDNSVAAARALCDIVQNPKVHSKLRCQAAEAILDRVYGKPKLPIDLSAGGKSGPIVLRFQGTLPDMTPAESEAYASAAPVKSGRGRFMPGASANPGGRRKYSPKVKKALMEGSFAAAQTLCEFVNSPETPPAIRIRAAEAVLDRVYGKAAQPICAAAGGDEPVEFKLEGVLEEWAR